MGDQFYDNDFEKFLQQQVKHHRLYPSDAVWKGIYKQMHGNRKWPGLYFFAILMVAALTVCTIFIESKPIIYTQHKLANLTRPVYDQLNPVQTTEHTFRNITKNNSLHVSLIDNILPTITPVENTTEPAFNTNEETERYQEISLQPVANLQINNTIVTDAETSFSATSTELKTTLPDNKTDAIAANVAGKDTAAPKNATDEYLEQHPEEADRILKQQLRTKPSKWQTQFYITPSLNYRQVVDENHASTHFFGPVANNNRTSANKLIRYKPGMGIEIGFGALYSLTNRIKIKAAFQYNIRQFNIEAYTGGTELAKIAVQRGDTVYALTKYRSSGVSRETELINKYHQLSIPVGLEYSLLRSKRIGIQIGGTIQPTYTFSQSAYLLTSDYKSYANGKEILRRWNVNSSLEATFSLKAKNVEWKFGPQLRYQHLPTYSDQYTIKEYLIDYGFKIGFTKTIQ
jgi:hypothetical protein